jgi:secreted PhoX family phosphatase
MDVIWVDIEDVESPKDNLRDQGYKKGAARFARGEGMWYADGEVYFACTNGGRKQMGQIFRYLPSQFEGTAREAESPGCLELFIESSDQNLLKNCDNLTIAENGNLFICEDALAPKANSSNLAEISTATRSSQVPASHPTAKPCSLIFKKPE